MYCHRQLYYYGFLVISAALLTACSPKPSNPLIIATAANAQFAITEIAMNFEESSGISTEVIISSSGKHTAQIEAGAPYDVFISADLKYPNRLYKLGITTDKPKIYAWGKLVLWTTDSSLTPDLAVLRNDNLNIIALPNSETAPYGIAAHEVLTRTNLFNLLHKKLVYGESISQTNHYITSGAAQIGFTSASTVLAPAYQEIGQWVEIDTSYYSPLAQGVVVIKSSKQPNNASKFYLYLFSAEAQGILKEYGYQIATAK